VRIVGVSSTPARPPGPVTPTNTPAPAAPPLPVAAKEATPAAPEPKPASKEAEAPKTPTTGASSITLAMRQMGEEAAQKAKDMKKKTQKKPEVFAGSGKAEAAAKDTKETETAETPSSVPQNVEPITTLQNSETSAWNLAPGHTPPVSHHALNELKSLQSPTSTAWKPADITLPTTESEKSETSTASAEKVKPVEKKETAAEEDGDEDDDEDEDDDDDEEDEDENEDEDDEEDEDDDEDDEDEDEDDDEHEHENEDNAAKAPKKA
jgi:hypothetical protein